MLGHSYTIWSLASALASSKRSGGHVTGVNPSYWIPTARRALIARVCDPRVKRSMIVPTPNRPSVKTHNTPRPI